ncbi:ABC transporter permease [Halopelagius longus]|uniref:ABC transporter permease n=1 Tax=Halopelagius longus TaxID=1236180 RepID=A0A1H0XQI7_9EURY|nr:ABC transporter permease [Halopelagius longus]RDI72006.1 ABC transporter permease [Halopelagius longus]SDQ04936.1 peptide/nickel transport system permease protein [Halopelagius longus]
MVSKRFLIKRLLLLVPVLFGVATLVFAILHLSPGDPARVIAGQRATAEQVAQVRADLGLNAPLWVQYGEFLLNVVTLDLGNSYIIQRGTPVLTILRARLPVTLELAIYGQLIGVLLGIPTGVISAVKQDTATDHVTRIGALTGISVPIYWSGPLVILLFAQFLNVLPASNRIASQFDPPVYTGLITVDSLVFGLQTGNFAAFFSAASHMFLPAAVIGIYGMALISRMMRSSMLEVIRQDYMRTARAKGQGAKITIMKHGFQNALIPVITVIGIQFGTLLGGAVLTETVFGIGGIGTMLVKAIEVGDYPVVQGTVLVFAFLFTLVNLGVDVTYSYLDPRIEQ